ncbi:MAG: hypothetical protein JNM29_22585 [Candidatus Odyssella sp.]|nr:hypothetical protein [Candidatus Odyssella sp.]
MKKTVRKIADAARVRTGDMSPAFPVKQPTKKIADSGKVRMGDMSPVF